MPRDHATRACLACGRPDGLRIYRTSDYDEPTCRSCGARHVAHVTAGCIGISADITLADDDGWAPPTDRRASWEER